VVYFTFSCYIVHKTPQKKINFMKSLKTAKLKVSETDTTDMDSRLSFFWEVSYFPFSNGIWQLWWCFEWGKILGS